jgi:hypothetical protein
MFIPGNYHSLQRVCVADAISYVATFDLQIYGTPELNECIFRFRNVYRTRRDLALFSSYLSRCTALPPTVRGSLGQVQNSVQESGVSSRASRCEAHQLNTSFSQLKGPLFTDMYLLPPIRFAPFQIASLPSANGDVGHIFVQSQTSAPTTTGTPAASPSTTQKPSGR